MITYTQTAETIDDLEKVLWGGAKEKWLDATEEQKEMVFNRVEEMTFSLREPYTLTMINDIVWFDCDDIFFPYE